VLYVLNLYCFQLLLRKNRFYLGLTDGTEPARGNKILQQSNVNIKYAEKRKGEQQRYCLIYTWLSVKLEKLSRQLIAREICKKTCKLTLSII